MSRGEILYPYDETLAAKVADVVGDASAHATALAELARRRAAGEDVALFIAGSRLVVGPVPRTDAVEKRQRISTASGPTCEMECHDALFRIKRKSNGLNKNL